MKITLKRNSREVSLSKFFIKGSDIILERQQQLLILHYFPDLQINDVIEVLEFDLYNLIVKPYYSDSHVKNFCLRLISKSN